MAQREQIQSRERGAAQWRSANRFSPVSAELRSGVARINPVRSASVLCLGNISLDETVGADGRRHLEAGGDAVYATLGALLAGGQARMLAPVGNDLPARTRFDLAAAGIEVDSLPRRDLPTLRHVITELPGGGRHWQNAATDDDFDLLSVQPADLSTAALDVDAVLLSAMGLRAQCALGPWLRGRTRGRVYLDLREDYLEHRDLLLDLIATADIFLPSEVEATTLARTSDLAAAARFFRAVGPPVVVVKRGARGALVCADDGVGEVPAAQAVLLDGTGAGDAFCGAFAAAHAGGQTALAAARIASDVAAVAVTGIGTSALRSAVAAVST